MPHPPLSPSTRRRALPALCVAVLAASLAAGPVFAGDPPGGHDAERRRDAAQAALKQLRRHAPRLKALWRIGHDGPVTVAGLDEPTRGRTTEARARAFLQRFPALLGGVSPSALRLHHVSRSHERRVARFAWHMGAWPVVGRFVAVSLDRRGHVVHLSSDVRYAAVPKAGPVNAEEAVRATALRWHGSKAEAVTPAVHLGFSTAVHVWAVDLATRKGPVRALVSSADGRIHQSESRAVR